MTKKLLAFLILLVACTAYADPRAPEPGDEPAAAPVATGPSFRRDVAPILVKNCIACHGPDKAESNYRVDTFERLQKPGELESPTVTAGKPGESELLRLVSSTDADERMPKEGKPLAAAEIEAIRKWIETGAAFDGPSPTDALASYIPRQPHPAPPESYLAPVPITAIAFHPSGTEIVAGGYHELTVWSAEGKLLRRLKNIAQRTHAMVFVDGGASLIVASGTPGRLGEVKKISAADGAEQQFYVGCADEAFDVAVSPDGKKIAVAAADRSIRIFDVASGKQERLIENHADWVMAVAWSADGTKLASGSRDKTAKVFEAATGQLLATYSGHNETVYGVAFKPDGKQVYSSGRDNKIHLWNVADSNRAADINLGGEVYKLLLAEGNLFCGSADKTARQFRESDRNQVRQFGEHGDWVHAVAVHGPTKRVATGAFDGEVRLWNLDDGKEVLKFVAAPGIAVAAAKP
jgi:WD40 repeat protein